MSTALTPYGARFVARKAFSVMGHEFRFFNPEGNLQFVVKQKAFKLKEDITVFADEEMKRPVLRIKARSIMDVNATYDVLDAANEQKVGALRRQGLKSVLRDEWTLLGANDQEIGKVQEDSGLMAILRRFLLKFLPQTFVVTVGDQQVGQLKQRFNPFRLTMDVDFSADSAGALDKRLGVAMTVLLLAVEGRQN